MALLAPAATAGSLPACLRPPRTRRAMRRPGDLYVQTTDQRAIPGNRLFIHQPAGVISRKRRCEGGKCALGGKRRHEQPALTIGNEQRLPKSRPAAYAGAAMTSVFARIRRSVNNSQASAPLIVRLIACGRLCRARAETTFICATAGQTDHSRHRLWLLLFPAMLLNIVVSHQCGVDHSPIA